MVVSTTKLVDNMCTLTCTLFSQSEQALLPPSEAWCYNNLYESKSSVLFLYASWFDLCMLTGEAMTIQQYLEPHLYPTCLKPYLPPVIELQDNKPMLPVFELKATKPPPRAQSSQEYTQVLRTRKMSVSGIVKRTRSIDLNNGMWLARQP